MSIAEIRDSLRIARGELQADYLAHPQPTRYLLAHSKQVDEHLRRVWRQLDLPAELALVAVGGYGRAELYPKSDIDLLILLPAQPDQALQQRLQELVGNLWDIGLEVGHSVRTIGDCMAESSDVTVQTNLLEARHITGNHALFLEMRETLAAHLSRRAFYLAKVQEQEQRHTRFVDTDYNLEPNLKESPGGLRDLQSVLWISRACGFGHTWKALAQADLITPTEARQIAHHEHLLQDLRIRLHYLSGRHDDRLLFEYQTALAEQLGISASAQRRASEHLMQHYYRTKQAVLQLNAVLLQTMRARIFPAAETFPLNDRFVARDDKLEARDEALFETQPTAILESFLLLEQHPRLTGFSAQTLRALWRARKTIGSGFRKDPRNRELFMAILRQPQGLTHALRRMNQQDILGRYLPPFGRIVGQMQHDLFHVYTVDEHILMVVRNLRRFTLPQYAHEYPLCSKLIHDFARPEVLYIAGIFHDIAKGRGGDHATLGRVDAARFCKQHGLMREDADLVVWLVEHHLTMSATAQKQDLSDQDVIAAFAAKIRNERYLAALYLLTVADIRGTSAKVWNAWKGQLLESLYHATRRFMTSGKVADLVGEIRKRSAETLSLYAIHPDIYELLWAQFDADYFLRHEPHEIAWHTRMLAHRVNSDVPVVKARLSRIGEGLQILVYTQDRPYLFARICNFFARMSYNIMEAKIHTTQHGYALDSFLVMDANNSKTVYRDVMNYIEYELAQQLADSTPPAAPNVGRVSRQLKHFPIVPQVGIARDEKGQHILSIVAGDRPGLLARIAYLLAKHHIELRSAKINTLGSRAEDTFWISGEVLDRPQEVDELRAALQQQLA
ncbi:bifunctional uridylyltransferase/uridylyl-removing enzyme [Sideroxyarcus emersonii]|uniref:Bifunctional uridylyltransferase/uridylyl-removing enzyme n=1 Tax=Sideroxyarcus emersonii TaxID=2764705 RepID=A0AAN1XAC9_9PROT|nr:[protein-PII] uridylyltransferase [Sideroxyarcus emersonii]BCK87664.1 bifunctional uridylyltransferase/uridylyl-removing enzyme [Sideroxyarcus emersonii]